jgi:cytochrome c peroxidase
MLADERTAVNRVFTNAAKALEAYMRRLIDVGSPFDRFLAGDLSQLDESEQRGARVFLEAGCKTCHDGAGIGSGKVGSIGVPQVGPHVPGVDRGFVEGIHKLWGTPFNACGSYSDDTTGPGCAFIQGLITVCSDDTSCGSARPTCDIKGAAVEGVCRADDDNGGFKTPTLRNIAKTGPYMHTGHLATLDDALAFYFTLEGRAVLTANGGDVADMNDDDIADLKAFLLTLDGDPLPADIISNPVENGAAQSPFTSDATCE